MLHVLHVPGGRSRRRHICTLDLDDFNAVCCKARTLHGLSATRYGYFVSYWRSRITVTFTRSGAAGCEHEDADIPRLPGQQPVGTCGACACILGTAPTRFVWFSSRWSRYPSCAILACSVAALVAQASFDQLSFPFFYL